MHEFFYLLTVFVEVFFTFIFTGGGVWWAWGCAGIRSHFYSFSCYLLLCNYYLSSNVVTAEGREGRSVCRGIGHRGGGGGHPTSKSWTTSDCCYNYLCNTKHTLLTKNKLWQSLLHFAHLWLCPNHRQLGVFKPGLNYGFSLLGSRFYHRHCPTKATLYLD